jgi:hypothetical protein
MMVNAHVYFRVEIFSSCLFSFIFSVLKKREENNHVIRSLTKPNPLNIKKGKVAWQKNQSFWWSHSSVLAFEGSRKLHNLEKLDKLRK